MNTLIRQKPAEAAMIEEVAVNGTPPLFHAAERKIIRFTWEDSSNERVNSASFSRETQTAYKQKTR